LELTLLPQISQLDLKGLLLSGREMKGVGGEKKRRARHGKETGRGEEGKGRKPLISVSLPQTNGE